jgi:hypothetical protein
MNNENTTSMNDVSNPHDKLFRETWSNLENARSFLHHYLPHHVLRLMDLRIRGTPYAIAVRWGTLGIPETPMLKY